MYLVINSRNISRDAHKFSSVGSFC